MKDIFSILLLIFVTSCSTNDSKISDDDLDLSGTFITAKVNGNNFEARPNTMGIPTISAALVEKDLVFSLAISGIDLNDNLTEGEGLALVLAGTNFNEIVNDFEVQLPQNEDDSFVFGGGFEITRTGNSDNTNFEFNEDSPGFFRITRIDKEAQIISGRFEFSLTETNSGEFYTITNGIFNEITYVLN